MLGHILANKFILSLVAIVGLLNKCKATLINLLPGQSSLYYIWCCRLFFFSFIDFVVVDPIFINFGAVNPLFIYKMVETTKFQVCNKFGIVDHFIDENRLNNTKLNTDLTV